MKLTKHTIILFVSIIIYQYSNAQGCVAIRSNGGTCTMMGQDEATAAKSDFWTFAMNKSSALVVWQDQKLKQNKLSASEQEPALFILSQRYSKTLQKTV